MMDSAQLTAHLYLLHSSFRHYVGRDLAELKWQGENTALALDTAPFVLLSHNTDADPIFTYGNQKALEVFEMDWETLTQLPSRYSAEALVREEREHLLQTVARQGYIDDYAGVRISSSGRRFLIRQAIVWNLRDAHGNYAGQAAYFDQWEYLPENH
ncbi:MEKHLA domain-containing protein [Thiothrix fructosivorans]|uniref:MEKHLA domain-containing protein n=1 Tax=Thiothrix fructosivorans TaxID=111770 RepID=A0A8B0SJE6_9GAMM|nr:MEKHLA domain-containing protein [Thiothrix fructosivorans]MBO0611764.1 MEKHLA domain-containing protein [Thiothrix fructosivorans]QTX10580.1 MEKHLA domain-containing protein [Thiothrix fructosivorans]